MCPSFSPNLLCPFLPWIHHLFAFCQLSFFVPKNTKSPSLFCAVIKLFLLSNYHFIPRLIFPKYSFPFKKKNPLVSYKIFYILTHSVFKMHCLSLLTWTGYLTRLIIYSNLIRAHYLLLFLLYTQGFLFSLLPRFALLLLLPMKTSYHFYLPFQKPL